MVVLRLEVKGGLGEPRSLEVDFRLGGAGRCRPARRSYARDTLTGGSVRKLNRRSNMASGVCPYIGRHVKPSSRHDLRDRELQDVGGALGLSQGGQRVDRG